MPKGTAEFSSRPRLQEKSTGPLEQLKEKHLRFRKVVLSLLILVPYLVTAPTSADPLTVGATLQGLKDLVQQLEGSAATLLEQGNTYASQQQMLLAGTLEATIRQIEEAYADSLDKTYKAFATAERNTFEELHALHKEVRMTLEDVNANVERSIYTTQSSVNQILEKLPLIERHPMVFGIRTRDLLLERENVDGDILVLGHLLSDPELELRKPEVRVAGKKINPSAITATQNRITVMLPEQLKKELRLGNTPCEPLESFETEIVVFYDDGSWINDWNPFYDGDEVSLTASSFPGNPFFEFALHAEGQRTYEKDKKVKFENKTGSTGVGCEDSASATVSFTVPKGANEINATADWTDTKRLKRKSASAAVTGLTATASGSIKGKDKDCFKPPLRPKVCNCKGGGKGKLRIKGTYVIQEEVTEPWEWERSASTRTRQASLAVSDDGKVDKLELSLKRRGCAEVMDTLTMDIPADRNARTTQNSSRGLFTAVHQQGQVTVTLAGGSP